MSYGERKWIYGAIYRDRYDLRRLQRPGGKSGAGGAGGDKLCCQPVDKFDVRGRHGYGVCGGGCCAGGGLRGVGKRRGQARRHGGSAGRPRNPGAAAAANCLGGVFAGANVYFHGGI